MFEILLIIRTEVINMKKYCEYCGKELTSKQKNNRFCSYECANAFKKEIKIQEWKDGNHNGLNGTSQLASFVRNYMLEKAEYKCSKCGWHETNPTTGLVPLEIHHKDGDYRNNKEDNLEVLCPNCHSLTSNFKALNKDGRRDRTDTGRKNYCIDCGAPITTDAIRCRACEGKNRITEKPITREELKDLIRTTPFTQIGNQFGVSDNAIRKWCKNYNLPITKKEIKVYTDEEWELI